MDESLIRPGGAGAHPRGNNMRFTILIIFLLSASLAFADEVSIENNLTVSADSGGNSASSGEIIQGTSAVDLEVETVINGVAVEEIEIHEESSSTPIIVEKEIINESEGAKIITNIKVEVNANNEPNYEEDVEPIETVESIEFPEEGAEERVSLRAFSDFFERLFERLLSLFTFF